MRDKDKYAYASCKVYQPGPKVLWMAGTEARPTRTEARPTRTEGRLKDRRRGRLRHWPAPPCMDLVVWRGRPWPPPSFQKG